MEDFFFIDMNEDNPTQAKKKIYIFGVMDGHQGSPSKSIFPLLTNILGSEVAIYIKE
jgi:hypothetical protein